MAAEVTRIKLGWTDGARFVGVQPSLNNDEESRVIAVRPSLGQGNIEQVAGANACSLVRIGNSTDIERGHQAARHLASQVAGALVATRSLVEVDTAKIVLLEGPDSSPFEPVTRR